MSMKQQAQIADCSVRPSDILWQEGGSYYTESPAQLRSRPVLPDLRCIFHRRLAGLFELAGADSRSHVLEIGCGASRWLPHVGRAVGCEVSGIEIEPFAAEL